MKRQIKLLTISLLLGVSISVGAQISEGGNPFYVGNIKSGSNKADKTLIYQPSISQQKSSAASNKMGEAITFAHTFNVNYTPDNSGSWQIINNMRVWQLEIYSPNAYTLNLIFDRYVLPEGAKLFIYNSDASDVIGAFTSKNNKGNGILATSPVIGDRVIVEYQEPLDAPFEGELLIGAVNHDYVGILQYDEKVGKFGDSGNCNVDVSCSELEGLDDIKRSVMRMIVNGSEYCTATLINNTSDNKKPYAITASHCFDTKEAAYKAVFLFNYEVPHCSSIIEGSKAMQPPFLSISSATIKCDVQSRDYALVELSEVPPSTYRPYYAGWSLDDVPTKPFASIHHPSGDVKKISTAVFNLTKSSFNTPTFESDFHWNVAEWYTGTTEGGSSGCALFDANNLLVGTLSGGAASCGNSVNDFYVRFNKAWDESGIDESLLLKTYLDPTASGVQSLLGYDPYGNDVCTRISNVEKGESPLAERIGVNKGFMGGHNSNQITMFAEHFDGIKTATIKGLYLMPSKYVDESIQPFVLSLWSGNSVPENKLYTESFVVGDLVSNVEFYVELPNEIDVVGDFFVSYELDYSSASVDSCSIYNSGNDFSKSNNSMMVKDGDTWRMASSYYGTSPKSLWIDVVASNVEWGDSTGGNKPDEALIKVGPNPFNTEEIYVTTSVLIDSYQVFDLNGRMLYSGLLGISGNKIPIKLPYLSSGVYLLKLHTNNGANVFKIVKSSVSK